MNFLIVDDNRLLSRFFVTFIHSKGHECAALDSGVHLEAWLELNPCDGLILDIGLPKIDGISLISLVRSKHPKLPIIIFTGMGFDEQLMEAAQKAGANGYVSKGLGPMETYCALMRAVSASPLCGEELRVPEDVSLG